MIRDPLHVFAALLLLPFGATLAADGAVAAGSELVLPITDLSGLQERLREDRGHPLLVNFWATWCVPCIHEIPTLNRMQQDLGPAGARFLAVSLDPFVYPKLPTPWSPPATLYVRRSNFPPAWSFVKTTSRAGFFSVRWRSMGIPRPSSTTVTE